MKCGIALFAMLWVATLALHVSSVGASALAVTPTQQVINMMNKMQQKGEHSLEEERKTHAKYAEWADDRGKELGFEVQTNQKDIEEFTAFITKADSDAKELGRDIANLDSEIGKLSDEKREATEIRKSEHTEYLELSKDYGESVDALQRAIQVMSAQDVDRSQAESLLQTMPKTVMPRVLAALAQEKSETNLRGDGGAPEVAAYSFQSGGIVEVLEDLFKKFKGELSDVEKAEVNQAHEYSLVEMHLSDTIAKDTSDRDEKTVIKTKKEAASAKARGELKETRKEKASNEALKKEIETTFKAKTATFNQNQKIRADELEAIGKAIEIISSPEVAGSYSEHVNFAQRAVSLLQVGRDHRSESLRSAARILSSKASSLRSKTLADAASHAAADPFAKVIGMIESLLDRLKEQAAAEADHKEWCDEQLKENKIKRTKKTTRTNVLTSDIEAYTANIADMGNKIATLSKEQAELTKAMAEATELRTAEKAENLATIADATAGIEAVSRATAILKEFYAAHQEALLQVRQVPEMAEYKGMQSSNGGVIGMLDVILTDFTRLKSETDASEKTAAREYDAMMELSETAKTKKHEAEVQLELAKDQAEFDMGETEKDRRTTQAELDKANEYYQYLKPNCVQVHVSYEERAARRKDEIEALRQAYDVLDQKSDA